MLILALDTTTKSGSVALVRDGDVVYETAGDPNVTHGARLPGEFARALEAAHARISDIDLLAVAAGPGSFTGLRVGIASIQGLAMAHALRVVPVSTLDALAQIASRDAEDTLLAPWMDAQRQQVFAALYAPDGRTVLEPPTSALPHETLRAWSASIAGKDVRFIGDGAVRYAAAIDESLGRRARVRTDVPLLAGQIGLMAARDPEAAVLPHAVVPIYIRRPDAEVARDAAAVQRASRSPDPGAG
jgi:tRNA threonylcarbamoyladenosine biosynthesis protein TsaB